MDLPSYFIAGAILVSFYACFMGGANDFANAFGTSVGSHAITIKQAVIIAIFAELIGAVLVGSHVTNTVRKSIVDPNLFLSDPTLLVIGLAAALVGSGLFLQSATHFGLPVSTTHAIVGAIMGFGIISKGFGAIKWMSIVNISLSWVISPIGGGIIAFLTFRIIQSKILSSKNPVKAANKVLPFFVGITLAVLSLSLVYKGLKNLHLDLSLSEALMGATVIGIIGGLISKKILPSGDNRRARVQNVLVEANFKYLQVFTAGYVAFAHGSNDVANGIGPLAGIWTVYKNGLVGLQSEVPVWILLMGGTGIVLGLAVFGHKVIETVGTKITMVTPSRGFSAEFSAATVVLVFSKLGMPVSTTHTLVGAVIGVGLARGIDAIDLRVIGRILMSWVVTIPAAAVATIVAFFILKAIFL